MAGSDIVGRYVALGSSFAAGPWVGRRRPGSPRRSGRSSSNYASLFAARAGFTLRDVTFTGATAAELLDGQDGAGPPQIEAVTPDTDLVTLTCGGNDVGYIGRLMLGSLRWPWNALPGARREAAETDELTSERLDGLGATFDRLLTEVRQRAPHARIVMVDYLTILPPDPSVPTGRLPAPVASWGRSVATRLSAETRAAAARHDCGFVAASEASRDRHAWSPFPWTRRYGIWPRDGAPFHPNQAGMRAVADLLEAAVSDPVGGSR
jgi:lysophospholipase L1-like esterase